MIDKDYWEDIPDAILIGNGEFPSHKGVRALMARTPYIVCCDGAADTYFQETTRLPDAVVGDGDSLSQTGRKRFADRLHIISEQENNDQSKAIRFLQSIGKKRIVIVGATGKREDHTIGNISLLIEYMRMGLEVSMFTDYGFFVPAVNIQLFQSIKGQQVSIFSFGTKDLRSEGLQYPLHTLNNWWEGTLNQAEGTSFRIFAEGEYLVYRAYL